MNTAKEGNSYYTAGLYKTETWDNRKGNIVIKLKCHNGDSCIDHHLPIGIIANVRLGLKVFTLN